MVGSDTTSARGGKQDLREGIIADDLATGLSVSLNTQNFEGHATIDPFSHQSQNDRHDDKGNHLSTTGVERGAMGNNLRLMRKGEATGYRWASGFQLKPIFRMR